MMMEKLPDNPEEVMRQNINSYFNKDAYMSDPATSNIDPEPSSTEGVAYSKIKYTLTSRS